MGTAPKKVEKDSFAALGKTLRMHVLVLVGFLAVMWIEEIVDTGLGGRLDAFGIRPRTLFGLVGIPLMPFLHAGFGHLLGNTPVFFALGWLVLVRETWHFFVVTAVVTILGGLGVWLIGGTGTVHVGASGLCFGFLGYLMLGGFFERRIGTIVGSLVVALVFGGLLWGVFPTVPGVSWEGHLMGFLAGAFCAWLLRRRSPRANG